MRSGRASTALVDRMMVDYYGQDTELRQIANISTPEAMLILIRPYDKAAVRNIEKAIQMSDIGVNPNIDGENIRLNMPALTRERRHGIGEVSQSTYGGYARRHSQYPPVRQTAICKNSRRKNSYRKMIANGARTKCRS